MSEWKLKAITSATKKRPIQNISVDDFRNKCISIILEQGKFLNKSKLARLVGVKRTTISSAGIDTDLYCEEAGFPRNSLKPKGDADKRLEFIKSIEDKYVAFIKKQGRCVALYEFLQILDPANHRVALAAKYYRYGIDVKKCHIEANVEFVNNYGMNIENIELLLRKMIVDSGRYVTREDVAMKIGCSRALLSLPSYREKLDFRAINLEYGYKAINTGFEIRILEYLTTLFPELKVEDQKSFPNLKGLSSDARSILRYDFYIPSCNMLIEADGSGHWDPKSMFYSEEVVKRDSIKNEYAVKNGIFLLRIRYSEKYDIKNFKNDISGTPLKLSVGQPAAKLEEIQGGSTTIPTGSRVQEDSKRIEP